VADGLASVVEQLVNRILRPLDMVVISRERIQQTLDEAAERGGRNQLDSARRRAPVDQIVRAADRARHSVGAGTSFPISGYDEMTASQVNKQLAGLDRPELRKVRDYESRHANRKSVLEAIDRALR
jgi:hypothetical protein